MPEGRRAGPVAASPRSRLAVPETGIAETRSTARWSTEGYDPLVRRYPRYRRLALAGVVCALLLASCGRREALPTQERGRDPAPPGASGRTSPASRAVERWEIALFGARRPSSGTPTTPPDPASTSTRSTTSPTTTTTPPTTTSTDPSPTTPPTTTPPTTTSTDPSPTTPPAPVTPPGLANPDANLSPSPAQTANCDGEAREPACEEATLAEIDLAQLDEGLPPLVLPANYGQLSPAEKLFVLVNEERMARGLPPAAFLGAQADAAAWAGAASGTDPTFVDTTGWTSDLATGSSSMSYDVFLWLYDDGVGSGNTGCPTAGSPGCWAHRDSILGDGPVEVTPADDYGGSPVLGAAYDPANETATLLFVDHGYPDTSVFDGN